MVMLKDCSGSGLAVRPPTGATAAKGGKRTETPRPRQPGSDPGGTPSPAGGAPPRNRTPRGEISPHARRPHRGRGRPMRFLRVNGHGMAYEARGTGAPVLLVHGSLADLRYWAPQMG